MIKEDSLLALIGSGGHAKVLANSLLKKNISIDFIISNDDKKNSLFFKNYKFISEDYFLNNFDPKNITLINGVGSVPGYFNRWKIAKYMRSKNYKFINIFDKDSIIAEDVNFLEGVQIMSGAIIQPSCSIGYDTIINTKTSIDHDCVIGDSCHLSPGVTISGNVSIANNVHVGAGANLINGISIGKNVVIAAGATIYKNIPDNATVKSINNSLEINIDKIQ